MQRMTDEVGACNDCGQNRQLNTVGTCWWCYEKADKQQVDADDMARDYRSERE